MSQQTSSNKQSRSILGALETQNVCFCLPALVGYGNFPSSKEDMPSFEAVTKFRLPKIIGIILKFQLT
ncbi:hypothetical protein ACU8KH_06618 [Lachancea thermotolerans]